MSLEDSRLCVFCGRKANDKTREHVVPYWLLEMTGDPSRVVTFGQDPRNGKPIRFSWSNFVAPACKACNDSYSNIEGRAKLVVQALEQREIRSVADYVLLLDWLDKVRTGVWLLQHMIVNDPVTIRPNFFISSRVGTKDRMLALYAFDGDNQGINLFGSDSLIFAGMPSCFGLRINNILLLNASCDFFCSRGCGLPHPLSTKQQIGGADDGMLLIDGIDYEQEICHPVTSLTLCKPVVWLYQPIKFPSDNPIFRGGYYGHANRFDSRIFERTLEGQEQQGAIFRQLANDVEILSTQSSLIGFDEVTGDECAILKDVVASIYDTQRELFEMIEPDYVDPQEPTVSTQQYRKLKIQNAIELAESYRDLGPADGPLAKQSI